MEQKIGKYGNMNYTKRKCYAPHPQNLETKKLWNSFRMYEYGANMIWTKVPR